LVKYAPVRTTVHTTTVVTKGDNPLALAAINNAGLVASSAAWPIGAVVIAHFFRAEIASFIRRLRNLKGLGMEASLDAYIQETLPPAAPDPDEPLSEQADDAQTPTDQIGSPIDAIVTSWLRVMEALNMSLKGKIPPSASFSTKIEQLRRQNTAPIGLLARLIELRTIRNRVVHLPDEQISSDSIKLYIENANQVIRELKSLT